MQCSPKTQLNGGLTNRWLLHVWWPNTLKGNNDNQNLGYKQVNVTSKYRIKFTLILYGHCYLCQYIGSQWLLFFLEGFYVWQERDYKVIPQKMLSKSQNHFYQLKMG